jgi:hypothetical protein
MPTTLTTAPLPLGTLVILDNTTGVPHIDGVLALDTVNVDLAKGVGSSIAPQATIPVNALASTGFSCRTTSTPIDALPGDWITIGPDGNRIGALLGGYCVLGSGPSAKARFETHQVADLARFVTENYEVYTGFGELKVHNKEGRCGLTFRGGVDQQTESGGGEEGWTFKVDIGDSGQFFTLEVCEPDGTTKAKLNITADGEVTIISTNGLSFVDAGRGISSFEMASNLITRVLQEMRETVEGKVTQTYGSDRVTSVAGGDRRVVGANASDRIMGHQSNEVSGSVTQTIYSGSAALAKPTNVGLETQVLNGSVILEAGNPLLGANPAALAGVSIISHNGDVTIGSVAPGAGIPSLPNMTVALNTNNVPGSVGLGAPAKMCVDNAVKFMPLQTLLQVVGAMIDAHAHPSNGAPPTLLVSPAIAAMTPYLMSQVVKIGL